MTRFDQRLEKDFSGKVYDEGALAAGELGLVSLKALVSEIGKCTSELAAAGPIMELDLKEACEVAVLEMHLQNLEEELAGRDPKEVARETRGMQFRQRFQSTPVAGEEMFLENFKG